MPADHVLHVEPFDPDDDTDRFTIAHPGRCATLDMPCHVGHYEDDVCLTSYFRHADDPDPLDIGLPVVGVGEHLIEGYTYQTCANGPWGAAEWDGGLRLVDPLPASVGRDTYTTAREGDNE
jgi:hypothetical protein